MDLVLLYGKPSRILCKRGHCACIEQNFGQPLGDRHSKKIMFRGNTEPTPDLALDVKECCESPSILVLFINI